MTTLGLYNIAYPWTQRESTMSNPILPLPWLSSLPRSCRERLRGLGAVESHDRGARLTERGRAETHISLVEEGDVHVLLDERAR